MEGIGPIVIAGFIVLIIILMAGGGRKNRLFCPECGWSGKGGKMERHHGQKMPVCPHCGNPYLQPVR